MTTISQACYNEIHMTTPPNQPPQTPQPVAYDANGQPLYAHPPQQTQPAPGVTPQPQVVYMARPLEPQEPHISEAVRQKHDDSKRRFPHLNLSDGEYVISAIRRHPIGLLGIWAVGGFATLLVLVATPYLVTSVAESGLTDSTGGQTFLLIALLMLAVLFFFGSVVATVIYNANRFFLTNESVIQHIQTSLFSRKEQTISLVNIEDASFRQHGLLQHLLNYGSLRLSTEGDETTYRFSFVAHPQRQVKLLNDAVEAFKNGRPFGNDD